MDQSENDETYLESLTATDQGGGTLRDRTAGPDLQPGSTLGPYRIERRIGDGAAAIVYLARDTTLKRDVALKVLRPEVAIRARERFLREVRLVAELSHPNVIGIYGAGEQDGLHYASMELMKSNHAGELARRRKIPWDEALGAMRQACRGLEAAWSHGVVHRDIKPSNLLIDSGGTTKVADFGLAKDLSADLDLTAEGVIVGTPYYVSPEQGCGRPVDHRSDLYSLGATLFHCIAGRPPFDGRVALEVIVRHSVEAPPQLPDDVPFPVRDLVGALMSKEPERRPSSYEEVISRIDEALADRETDQAVKTPILPQRSRDGLATSQLAAARAAAEIGRAKRAMKLYQSLFDARGPEWTEAAFGLASLHETLGEFERAREILLRVAEEEEARDIQALALWTLGNLAEKESSAAIERAVDAYRKVLDVSGTAFPKTLLEARMARLERRGGKDSR